jgi:hypothetical protein
MAAGYLLTKISRIHRTFMRQKPPVMSYKFAFGLLIGIAAGAAIVHYLETEEGKAFADRIKKDLSDLGDNLEEMASDIVAKGRSFMDKTEV